MPAANPTTKEDIYKLVMANPLISQRDAINELGCGFRQFKKMRLEMVEDKELWEYTKLNLLHLCTFNYHELNNIPAREKPKTKYYNPRRKKKYSTSTGDDVSRESFYDQRLVDQLMKPLGLAR